MKEITNTTEQYAKNPAAFLAKAMAIGGSAAIEADEAAGQFELVNSQLLPTDGSNDPLLAQWGIVFGEPVPGDPMFRSATLPAGWVKKPSDHSMWSHIVDDKGRVRIRVFYKAASYDRSAHMGTNSRFSIRQDYDKHGVLQFHTNDGDEILFSSKEVTDSRDSRDWRRYELAQNELRAECEAWLDANRPKWRDPVESWTD